MTGEPAGRDPERADERDGGEAADLARRVFGAGSPVVSVVRVAAHAVQRVLEILAQAKLVLLLLTFALGLLVVVLILAVIVLLLQL